MKQKINKTSTTRKSDQETLLSEESAALDDLEEGSIERAETLKEEILQPEEKSSAKTKKNKKVSAKKPAPKSKAKKSSKPMPEANGAFTPTASDNKVKAKLHGPDAEGYELKKSKKKHKKVSDDRIGPLKKMKTRDYLAQIMPLHVELLKCQNWIKEEGLRIVALFEGRDAAGKGGTIKRFIEHMNPRGCRVVALNKPSDTERAQWYFQRYVQHLPTAGEIVLFDRSWYNRSIVERVMGFCSEEEVGEFLHAVPELERMFIRSGILMTKFYFSVSKKEQKKRFNSRLEDPLKQWKLSPVDREGQNKWHDYTKAKEDMFAHTSTDDSPWIIIKSDDKKRARLNAIRFFLSQFNYPDKREDILAVDSRIVRTVEEELGVED